MKSPRVNAALLRKLGLFMTGNLAAQGFAAISGLLLARWMSVNGYGAYTIVTTLMGAITVLTKGGSHLAYSAILGRVWPDMNRAAEAVLAVLRTRRRLSTVIMPPILLMAWLLLRRSGVDILDTIVVVAMLIAFWWADMRTRLIDQILFFAQQTTRIQVLDAALSAVRLALVVALHLTGLLSLLTAVAVGVLVAALRIGPILSWVRKLLPDKRSAGLRSEYLAEIHASVRRQMPVEVYYVFQAQLVLAVLSIFGSVNEIAGFGALTRINQLLLPIEALTYAFLVPIFTKGSTKIALRRFLPLVVLTMLPGAALVLISLIFPQGLLWLIGTNYIELQPEIFVAALVAMLTRGAGTAWNLLAHRGWAKHSWVQIPVGLTLCATSPFVLDLGSIRGALLLQLAFTAGLVIAAVLDFRAATMKQE